MKTNQETGQLKYVLQALATKRNIPLPIYQFTTEGEAHCPTFTATVEINGASYTGAPGNNKKEAAGNAAYEAIRSMHTQDCELLSIENILFAFSLVIPMLFVIFVNLLSTMLYRFVFLLMPLIC